MRADVEREVSEAVKFAEDSPYPDRAETYTDVFVG
jgi:acetoin:2,6-dichlorophenolindophenol oxidoreductase subunit alpha